MTNNITPEHALGIRNLSDADLRRMLDTVPASAVGSDMHNALLAERARRAA